MSQVGGVRAGWVAMLDFLVDFFFLGVRCEKTRLILSFDKRIYMYIMLKRDFYTRLHAFMHK